MKYYLQIVKDNVSILVDSDVGYYHQFKIDDVIEVVMDDNLGISLNINGWVVKRFGARFIIDWDKKDYQQLSIASSIMKGYMVDIRRNLLDNFSLHI